MSHDNGGPDFEGNWPDTLAIGPGGWLYITTSQIHHNPVFDDAEGERGTFPMPFAVYRVPLGVKPPAPAAVD